MFEIVPQHAAPALEDAQSAAAWRLTRRLSPRSVVRVMVREADGGLHENVYPRFFRVGPAAPSTPWALPLADDDGVFRLLCFDFDGKEKDGADAVERAVDDCGALTSVLEELSLPFVVCRSSAGGGRHVWMSIPAGADAESVGRLARAARANFRSLDHGMLLNPRQGAARPPLSPHRDGSFSQVLAGDVVEDLVSSSVVQSDLDGVTVLLQERKPALRAENTLPSGPVDLRHRAHRSLSAWGEGHMATIGGGSNPSWTGFMCLLAAANAGWSIADVREAVRTAPGMEHYRTKNTGRGDRRLRGAREAAERLERQWEKAQQYAALHSRMPAAREPRENADLSELEGIVSAISDLLTRFTVSPGRWGRTERSLSERTIITALAYLTLQTGKRDVAASIRDLALLSGLGRTTAAAALTGLEAAGFVQLVAKADGGNASEWRLTSDFSTASGIVRSQPLNNPRPPAELFDERLALNSQLEYELADMRHDLFTRAGIGHLAGKTYALLRNQASVTVRSAARLLGVTERHAATVLGRLRVHRLLVSGGDGWTRSKRDLRTAAARALGVDGLLKDRAERYGMEREVWAWWQAEVAHRSSRPRERPRRPHVTSRPLFEPSPTAGERVWPLYPRDAAGRGDHREAYEWARNGSLKPGALWWSSRAA